MAKDAVLMIVEEHFDVSGQGLVLLPDFDVLDGSQNRAEIVLVVTPVGQQSEHLAKLNIVHFNFGDANVEVKHRWRFIVTLPSASKDTVPIGSKISCEGEVKAALTVPSHI